MGPKASHDLYLSLRDEHKNELIKNLIDSNSNYHPCLLGYVKLTLKKEGESSYKTELYFFHICGDKSAIGGDEDYRVKITNNDLTMEVTNVDYFYRQDGSRLW